MVLTKKTRHGTLLREACQNNTYLFEDGFGLSVLIKPLNINPFLKAAKLNTVM